MSEKTASGETIQAVIFVLYNGKNKEYYGAPVEEVREIRPMELVTRIPGARDEVKGVMNLRGKVIPVVDVKTILRLTGAEGASSKSMILVSDVGGKLTGLLVDEVEQVMRISLKDIELNSASGSEQETYVKGIAKLANKLIVLVELRKLLAESGQSRQAVSASSQY
ncbi:MAG: chemotaxis protein CheW [Thaumarchaeota archaeon]|nr:chemotaxis protein CheW [Nitrososphaerota archaeon]